MSIKGRIYDILNTQTAMPIPSYGGWLRGWKPIKMIYPHEPETVAFFRKHIKPGMTVVDAGANVGFFTLLFSDLTGSAGIVHAFEPDSVSYKRLLWAIRHKKNVRAVHAAVGKPGEMNLYGRPGSGKNTLVEGGALVERVTVVAMPDGDIAKIDVEGAELDVLENMKPMPCVVEYAPLLCPPDYLDRIRKLGYRISKILPNGDTVPLDETTLPKAGHCNLFIQP